MAECLDSVLNQRFTDVEIVVCDDHSTDGTYDILLQYQRTHNNITVLRNRRNMGVTPSRHRAIEHCHGKYITTLDHDDIYLSKDKLSDEMALVQTYKETYHKDVCAFSDIIIIDQNSRQVRPQWERDWIKQGNIFEDVISRSGMIPRDFLFLREDYFQIGGFDARLKLYEDWDLKIRLARLREFYFTGRPGTGYRRISTGLSYSFSQRAHLFHMKKVFRKNAHLIPENSKVICENEFKKFLENKKSNDLRHSMTQLKSHIQYRRILPAITLLCKYIRLRMVRPGIH